MASDHSFPLSGQSCRAFDISRLAPFTLLQLISNFMDSSQIKGFKGKLERPFSITLRDLVSWPKDKYNFDRQI